MDREPAQRVPPRGYRRTHGHCFQSPETTYYALGGSHRLLQRLSTFHSTQYIGGNRIWYGMARSVRPIGLLGCLLPADTKTLTLLERLLREGWMSQHEIAYWLEYERGVQVS